MRLSEFYTNEKFYYIIDGVSFPRTSCKTENGELYVDEENYFNCKYTRITNYNDEFFS